MNDMIPISPAMLFAKITLIAGGSLMAITSSSEGIERIGGWGLAVAGLYSLWNQLNKERSTRDELHEQHLKHIEDERKRTEALIDKLEAARIEADKRADERSEAFLVALKEASANVGSLETHCKKVWRNKENAEVIRRANNETKE